MRTPKRIREREATRKARKRLENREKLKELKQNLYLKRTGIWISDPKLLHWHHTDPTIKTRKVCHLVTRSWDRIQQEIQYCKVLHENEHFKIHGHNSKK